MAGIFIAKWTSSWSQLVQLKELEIFLHPHQHLEYIAKPKSS